MRLSLTAALAAALLTATACEQAGSNAPAATAPGSSAGPSIAYVNIDSVLSGYVYLADQRVILENRQADASADLERRGRKLQGQFESFQRRAQSGNLTPKQIENEQRVLARNEQELQVEQQRIAYELQGEGARLQSAFTSSLRREVEALRTERGYDFVFSYGTDAVLAVNESYDVTAEVLSRMNAGPAPEDTDLDSTTVQ